MFAVVSYVSYICIVVAVAVVLPVAFYLRIFDFTFCCFVAFTLFRGKMIQFSGRLMRNCFSQMAQGVCVGVWASMYLCVCVCMHCQLAELKKHLILFCVQFSSGAQWLTTQSKAIKN